MSRERRAHVLEHGTFHRPDERSHDEQEANGSGDRTGCPDEVDRRRKVSTAGWAGENVPGQIPVRKIV